MLGITSENLLRCYIRERFGTIGNGESVGLAWVTFVFSDSAVTLQMPAEALDELTYTQIH